jgi:hypothetical protein
VRVSPRGRKLLLLRVVGAARLEAAPFQSCGFYAALKRRSSTVVQAAGDSPFVLAFRQRYTMDQTENTWIRFGSNNLGVEAEGPLNCTYRRE